MQDTKEGHERAIDLLQRETLLGLNHLAFDVSHAVRHLPPPKPQNLTSWIDDLNSRSVETFGKSLRIGLEPQQRMIGRKVYEMAFLYDADGSIVEVLNFLNELEVDVKSGWTPWDGKGFRE
eukprot:CAMPEP_0172511974 /NCGR_PEP_ID=MMETSP1066-20121228/240702_1 /TAXON_ID=671091 /ORGANISM="Coscinodiscus wailesii, Strain CCMP2513" /LENGTH=120 /DNA_ID=CAMNT_0013291569 /DNA_START=482 /DNA_END=844 /DNA_ORIENTATION=+